MLSNRFSVLVVKAQSLHSTMIEFAGPSPLPANTICRKSLTLLFGESMNQLMVSVIAALFGALLPLLQESTKGAARRWPVAFESPFGRLLLKVSGVRPKEENDAASLLSELSKASTDMDRIVGEIGRLTKERQARMVQLENDLSLLSEREQELKTRIEGLEKTPTPVADYFAKLVERTEKRSAARDYALFLGGVVLTSVIAILLKKLGWG
jgi:hypothetical protein